MAAPLLVAQLGLNAAAKSLQALIGKRPDDAVSRALAARVELLRADLSGEGIAARDAVQAALRYLEDVAPLSHDRRVLDPWVRALIAAGRVADAEAPLRELQSMDYRQPGFVDYYTRYLGEKRHGN